MPQILLGDIVSISTIDRKGVRDIPSLSMSSEYGFILDDKPKDVYSNAKMSKVARYGQLVTGLHMDEGSIWVQTIVPEGVVSGAYGVFDVDLSLINPDYLNYVLHTRRSLEFYNNSGVGNNLRRCKVPWESLRMLPVWLPSLEEQAYSVSLMRLIGKIKSDISSSMTLITKMESRILSEQVKNPESKSIEEVADLTFGRSLPSDYGNDNSCIPLCSGASDFGVVYTSPKKKVRFPDRIVEPGTVLLSIRDPVGKTNIALERCAIGRGVVGITPKQDICDTDYLYLSLNNMETELDSIAYGVIKSIGSKDVRNIKIDLIPIDGQRRIALIFNRLEELRTVFKNMLISATQLEQKVLEERFGIQVVS